MQSQKPAAPRVRWRLDRDLAVMHAVQARSGETIEVEGWGRTTLPCDVYLEEYVSETGERRVFPLETPIGKAVFYPIVVDDLEVVRALAPLSAYSVRERVFHERRYADERVEYARMEAGEDVGVVDDGDPWSDYRYATPITMAMVDAARPLLDDATIEAAATNLLAAHGGDSVAAATAFLDSVSEPLTLPDADADSADAASAGAVTLHWSEWTAHTGEHKEFEGSARYERLGDALRAAYWLWSQEAVDGKPRTFDRFESADGGYVINTERAFHVILEADSMAQLACPHCHSLATLVCGIGERLCLECGRTYDGPDKPTLPYLPE